MNILYEGNIDVMNAYIVYKERGHFLNFGHGFARSSYRRYGRQIAEASVDFQTFFEREESLDALDLKGFRETLKRDLTFVLTELTGRGNGKKRGKTTKRA